VSRRLWQIMMPCSHRAACLPVIKGFAGQDIGVAVFYPEDDGYLIDRETTVTHYDVAQAL
jgi:hypothetical protein